MVTFKSRWPYIPRMTRCPKNVFITRSTFPTTKIKALATDNVEVEHVRLSGQVISFLTCSFVCSKRELEIEVARPAKLVNPTTDRLVENPGGLLKELVKD
eukprot:633048-Hanusia_phi.AAC.6